MRIIGVAVSTVTSLFSGDLCCLGIGVFMVSCYAALEHHTAHREDDKLQLPRSVE